MSSWKVSASPVQPGSVQSGPVEPSPFQAGSVPSGSIETGSTQTNSLERLQGLFLTTLNHEIRTPLAGLMGMTDLLLETNLDEEQREYASTARLCAEDLLRILSAALQYSALASGQVKLEESDFNVRELAEAAVAEHAVMAQTKNLRLFSTLDASLPPTVIADGFHIKEILGYLLSNAIKFTQHGMVELAASYENETLRFSVRDTGIGIPTERREQIFKSFRQLDEGLAREYNGVGLGLTLAEKLLQLMKGRLTLESQPSQGSTFRVEIPVRSPESISHQPDTDEFGTKTLTNDTLLSNDTVAQSAGVPLVLAVEDNPIGATVIRHALKRYPVALHSAASGEEAVASASRRQYALILMDLQMPGMNGLEATAAIRKLPGYQDTPILALTADMSDDVRHKCYQSGMCGYLTKPIQSAPLWAAIQRELKLEA
jgi:CheY-like chemotaxis protein